MASNLKFLQNKKIFQLSLIAFLCLIIYFPSLRNAFIWDDDTNLYNNPWVQKIMGLKSIWLSDKLYQYYPLDFTTFWIEHKLWGLNPFGYHAVNLSLHILNALLVFWVIRRLYARLAFPVALLFAIHPIQVETVAWITERKNLLSLFFFLLAVPAYLRFDRTKRAKDCLVTVAMFVCAMLSKPVAICFIFFPVLYKWWRDAKVTWREIKLFSLFAAIGLLPTVHTLFLEYYHVGAQGRGFGLTFLQRFILSGRILFFYIYKLIFPFNFIFFYPPWTINIRIWWQWLFTPVAILAICLFLRYSKRIGRGLAALFIFYVISIFPVLGFINVYGMKFSYVADHFSYLSTPVLLLLICASATFISDKLRIKYPITSYAFLKYATFAFLIIYMCSTAMMLTKNYKNETVLWSNLIRQNPKCGIAYNNLAAEYISMGENEKAIALSKKAIEIEPDEIPPRAYYNLGNAYYNLGRKEEAMQAGLKAIEIDPRYAEAYNNLASVYSEVGRIDKAIELWNKVIQIDPNFAIAHFNLAVFYYRQGKYGLAIQHCDKVIELGNEVDPKFLKLLEPHRNKKSRSLHKR